MTKIVIVGEIYNADLSVGGGPVYPGGPSGPTDPSWGVTPPVDPGYGRPGWERPPHIWGQRPPHVSTGPIYGGGYPSGGPVRPGGPVDPGWGGGWGGGNYPSGGPVRPYPDQGLPPPSEPPAGGNPVPEDVYTPAPVPEELASQYIASVYDPKTMTWTTKSYPPQA